MNRDRKDGIKKSILGLSILLIALSSFLTLNMIQKQIKINSENVDPEFGEQGLPYHNELSKEPLSVSSDYVFFSDRILEIYHNSDEAKNNSVNLIQGVTNKLPQSVTKTVILIPNRIAYEDEFLQYSDDPIQAINDLRQSLPNSIDVLDIDGALRPHQDEYIFYRTDDGLTPLGCYYAARDYLSSIDITMKDLDQYYEYTYKDYAGVYYSVQGETLDTEDHDNIEYYLLPGGTNWETLTTRNSSANYETYECPAIAISRKGTNIFVAGSYSHAIIKGDNNNGKTLLVMGDGNAKVFATWMIPYFENIYVMSPSFYNGGKEGFGQIFKNFQITNAVIVESIDNMGSVLANKKLFDLFELK